MTEQNPLYKIQQSTWLWILAAVVSGSIAWSSVQSSQAANARMLEDHEMRLRIVESLLPRIDEALKPIARMDDRLRAIEKAVKN